MLKGRLTEKYPNSWGLTDRLPNWSAHFSGAAFRYPTDTTSADTSYRFREIRLARSILPSETCPLSPTYVFIF